MRKIFLLFIISLLSFHYVYAQAKINAEKLLAAAYDGDYEKVDSLITLRVNVNFVNDDGVTALMYAAESGYIKIAELLINNGALIDTFSWNGRTPLIASTRAGNFDMSELLIRSEADIDAKDIYKSSALHYSVSNSDYYMTDMLLYYNANYEIKDKHGNTPFLHAAIFGADSIVNLLAKKGANITIVDTVGNNAIIKAMMNNYPQTAILLINMGVDVNAQNTQGYSSLHIAAMYGYTDVVKSLIAHNAQLNVMNNDSLTPFNLAKIHQQYDVMDILKDKGVRQSFNLLIDRLVVSFDNSFSYDDYLLGARVGLMEANTKIILSFGYQGRVGYTTVFVSPEDDLVYQFWEKRHQFILGLEKNIPMAIDGMDEKGIYIGVKEIYSFGNYKGSNQKAKSMFITSPEIGIYLRSEIFTIKAGYQFSKVKVDYLSPHRINLSLIMDIPIMSHNSYTENYPYWID